MAVVTADVPSKEDVLTSTNAAGLLVASPLDSCLEVLSRVRKTQTESVTIISIIHGCVVEWMGCESERTCARAQHTESVNSAKTINRALVRLRVTEVKLSALQLELWESAKTTVLHLRTLLEGELGLSGCAARTSDIEEVQQSDKSNQLLQLVEQCHGLAQLQREAVQSLYVQLCGPNTAPVGDVMHSNHQMSGRSELASGGKKLSCTEDQQNRVSSEVVKFVQRLEDLMHTKQRVFDHLESAIRDAYGFPADSHATADGALHFKSEAAQSHLASDPFVSVSSDSTDENVNSLCARAERCAPSGAGLCPGGSGPVVVLTADGMCRGVDSMPIAMERRDSAMHEYDEGVGGICVEECIPEVVMKSGSHSQAIEYPSGQDVDQVIENAYLRCLLEAKCRLIAGLEESLFGATSSYFPRQSFGNGVNHSTRAPFSHPLRSVVPPSVAAMDRDGGGKLGKDGGLSSDMPHTIDSRTLRDELNAAAEICLRLHVGIIELKEEKQRWRQIALGLQKENELLRECVKVVRKYCESGELNNNSSDCTLPHEGEKFFWQDQGDRGRHVASKAPSLACPPLLNPKGCGGSFLHDRVDGASDGCGGKFAPQKPLVSTISCELVPSSGHTSSSPLGLSIGEYEAPSICKRGKSEGVSQQVVDRVPLQIANPTRGRALFSNDSTASDTPKVTPSGVTNSVLGFERSLPSSQVKCVQLEQAPQVHLPLPWDKPVNSVITDNHPSSVNATTYIEKILTSAQSCLVGMCNFDVCNEETSYSRADSFGVPRSRHSSPHVLSMSPSSGAPSARLCTEVLSESLQRGGTRCSGEGGSATRESTPSSGSVGTVCNAPADMGVTRRGEGDMPYSSYSSALALRTQRASEASSPSTEEDICPSVPESAPLQPVVHQSMLRELRGQLLLLQSNHTGVVKQKELLLKNRDEVSALLQWPSPDDGNGPSCGRSPLPEEIRYQAEKLLDRLDAAQESVCKREAELQKRVEAVRQYISSLRGRGAFFVQ